MEPLQAQLASLPKKLLALPRGTKIALGAGVFLLIALAIAGATFSAGNDYQYAFTNLTNEDAGEIGVALKSANVPYRLEAGGSALAVPAAKVYEVRLLLASQGLPRNGGSGFELFDKGDFGVSEFTQKVNLRRATEGELARTIGRIAGVRSARIHLVLPEKGVFRGEERAASAAVMLNLQPGRALTDREISGIRHLVASAVPSLNPGAVTIIDGRGSVLAGEDAGEDTQGFQKRMERDLEQRVVSLLEPVVGAGQVLARVNAAVDASEVSSVAEQLDPDGAVLKSGRTASQNQQTVGAKRGGLVGAAANTPLLPSMQGQGEGPKSNSNSSEETRNFEISKTSTRTVQRAPRLTRLSLAIVVDGVDGKPRSDAELARLGELARKAVGFDTARGDQLEISSSVFARSTEEAVSAPVAAAIATWMYFAGAGAGVLVLAVAMFLALRKKGGKDAPLPQPVLRAGVSVAELEATTNPTAKVIPPPAPSAPKLEAPAGATALPNGEELKALPDPLVAARERARELARVDPARAASLIKSWLSSETKDQPNA